MTILHITAGLSFGGVAEVAARLALYQQRQGGNVTLATVADATAKQLNAVDDAVNAGVKLVRFAPSVCSSLYFSREMLAGLPRLIQDADVVHVHSNWTFPVWWGCRTALKHKKKLIMTPHGCLSPERLNHSSWKKKLVGALDRHYLRRATGIHATCETEACSIKFFIEQASVSQRLSRRVAPGLSRSEAAGSNASGGAGSNAPGGAGSSAPGGAGSSAPGGAGSSAPGGAGSNAPGGAGSSAPGGAGSSAPGGAGSSAPGGAGSSAPDGAGSSAPGGAGSKVQSRLRRWFKGLGSVRVRECASVRVDKMGVANPSVTINYQSSTYDQQRPRVVVIPNGVDLKEFDGEIDENFWKNRYPVIGNKKVVLALGRLHPLKGLDLLLEAASQLVQQSSKISRESLKLSGSHVEPSSIINHQLSTAPEWVLVIAGPDEQGTLTKLKAQLQKLGIEERVIFTDAIAVSERKDAIGSAHCLVLPSRHENFGLTVIEALAAGVPVIATKGTPWAELRGEGSNAADAAGSSAPGGAGSSAPGGAGSSARVAGWFKGSIRLCPVGYGGQVAADAAGSNAAAPLVQDVANENNNSSFIPHPSSFSVNGRCGWWVDIGVEPLAEALREAMDLTDEERQVLGQNGRKLVEQKYQWCSVAKQMIGIYDGIVKSGR